MPGIHFVGTIEYASGNDADAVSLTWEILPGIQIVYILYSIQSIYTIYIKYTM